VLIVDDNEDARLILEGTLAYLGAFTIVAASGKEALERLASVQVDVIVSDLTMPGFSGYDFIAAVRRLPNESSRTPAIALTGYDARYARAAAEATGFQAYLVKPVDGDTLAREIVRLVEERTR
jgi:two-component system CheB/CheR fusion protein